MASPALRPALAAAAATLAAATLIAPCAVQADGASALADAVPATDPGDPAGWRLSLRSAHHSDALPLARLGGDAWGPLAPRPGRNLAYVDDEARLSRRGAGGWTWSLLARSQATLVATDDALALAAQVDAGGRPATDRHWAVDARLRAFAGTGLALGRAQALAPGWTAQWELQALSLGRWRERRLDGPVDFGTANGPGGGYRLALRSDEWDNHLRFPFQQPAGRRGLGLLLAAGVAWQGDGAWARAGLRDGGWLRWRGLPQQQATLDTATATTDADGFLLYQPLVQGQNRQDGLTRRLPWRATLAAGADLPGRQRLGLGLDTLPGWGALPRLQWQRAAATADGAAWGAEWQLHEHRLDLSLDWRGLALTLGADRLGSGARSRAWALAWRRTL